MCSALRGPAIPKDRSTPPGPLETIGEAVGIPEFHRCRFITAQAGYGSIGMTGSVLPGFSNPEFPYGLSSVRGFPGSLASALGLARVAVEEDLVALLEA